MGRLIDLYRYRNLREFNTFLVAYDAYRGHGYGRVSTPIGSGEVYQYKNSYPYTDDSLDLNDDVEEEDLWPDESTEDEFFRKIGVYYASRDANRGRGNVDRSSFVQGGRGLGESLGVSTSIAPFPNMYQDRKASGVTGGIAWTVYKTAPGHKGGRHGSLRGWWGAPPPMMSDVGQPAYSWKDIPSDDERSLQRAKATLRRARSDHEFLTSDFETAFLIDDEEEDFDDFFLNGFVK